MSIELREGLGLHADALMLRERRNAVLQVNIANAATPGYLARDFDFAQALRDAARHGGSDQTFGGGGPVPGYRVPVSSSLDGNTVDMGVEQMAFAENTLRYQSSLEFLNRRIAGLMSAIKGE